MRIISSMKTLLNFGRMNKHVRDNWIEQRLLAIPEGKKILDVGAGEKQYKKFCTHLNYLSHDFNEYDGDIDPSALSLKKWNYGKLDIISDILNIPVKDSSFDILMCTEVFEHIPEPIGAIKEFRRLLKTDGVLLLTAPFCSLTHMAPYFFYTGYSKYFYKKILAENGFTIEELSMNGNYFQYIAQELYRTPSFSQIYCGGIGKILSIFFKISIIPVIFLLSIASSKDKNSSDSLCFGIHIKAVKIS